MGPIQTYMERLSKIICVAMGCLFSLPAFSQLDKRIGEWTTYLSHRTALESVMKNDIVYTITSGGMFTWDEVNKETRIFSTVEGMSDIDPTTIFLEPNTQTVFIGYRNGMIDFFEEEDRFQYLTDIARNNFYTRKRINQFASGSGLLAVATDFGMVTYDVENKLPRATITQIADNSSRQIIRSVAFFDGRIWLVHESNRLYSAPADFPNLSDPGIWQLENGANGLPITAPIFEIASNSTGIYARTDTSLLVLAQGGIWAEHPRLSQRLGHITVQEDVVSASIFGFNQVYYLDGRYFNFYVGGDATHTLVKDNIVYVSNRSLGMERFQEFDLQNLTPAGPPNNLSIQVSAGNGELYIAPKGYNEFYGPIADGSGVYYYSRELGWRISSTGNGALPQNRANTGYARTLYDPETQEAYMGSWGKGFSRFKEGQIQEFFDCFNADLSTIDGICDTFNLANTRVSGIDFDVDKNIWITMAFAQDPLMARQGDGTWVKFNKGRIPGGGSLQAIDMVADDYGGKWILNRNGGVIVYNENQTFDTFQDDISLTLTANPSQGNLPSNDVRSIAKDNDGLMWVGTGAGVTLFFDVFSISQGSIVNASPPIFAGRPLLEGEVVNAIAVDGGNRKWFATGSGAFLMSADGTEQIEHFTRANSPLLTDQVNDIAVDASTGEVFFATDKGVISYRGDATAGSRDCEGIYVFPNPVQPQFDGQITIQGTAPNSIVKIISVSGKLVRQLIAQGGTAIWDGRDVRGNKVATGVYLVLSATSDGETPCIAKFSVIR